MREQYFSLNGYSGDIIFSLPDILLNHCENLSKKWPNAIGTYLNHSFFNHGSLVEKIIDQKWKVEASSYC